jgi:NADPH:quinone reductase-like Zn-dependent oxidoreductase
MSADRLTKPAATDPPAAEAPTMRAVVYRRYGPPDVLAAEQVPPPAPRDGEVLVRVRAVAVTAADAALRAGVPFAARLAAGVRRPRSAVLGSEVAGEVAAIGPGVTGWRVGDRVAGAAGAAMGGYAELVRLAAAGLAPVPDSLSLTDAVAVTEGGLAALPFLRDHAKVGPGDRVLVNGASGAVGSAAVQLARHLGARVTGVCSAANAELVRSLGADEVIDYRAADFTAARDAYDVVLDAVGTRSFRECRAALRPGGVYLTTVPTAAILFQMVRTRWLGSRRAGIAFTGLRRPAEKARDLATILGLVEAGELRPVIDRICTLEQVPQAHRHVDTGRKRGAVVVVV